MEGGVNGKGEGAEVEDRRNGAKWGTKRCSREGGEKGGG